MSTTKAKKPQRQHRIDAIAPEDYDRIIKMALEDRTPFEWIEHQFGLKPDDVVKFMRSQLSSASFLRWRKRVSERAHLKHPEKLGIHSERFKSKNQRVDGSIKENRRKR